MSTLLDRLHQDHARLARLASVLRTHIQEQYQGRHGRGGWLDLLACLVDYVSEYPDAVHHPLEDRVFERLIALGLTPAERKTVECNLAEHAALSEATRRMAADVDAVLAGKVVSESNLVEDATAWLDLQLSHMRREETVLFPLAERMFTQAVWREIEAEEADARDPLFDQRLDRYDALFDFVTSA
jgi:hemerythrin-like domain-containing protein